MANYFLGMDVSTTATKALLIAEDGRVVGAASHEYPFDTPRPLWSEQPAELWWQAAVESICSLLAKTSIDPAQIQAVGLTGQMHGLVLLDSSGRPLRPAILWNDQRTGSQCDEIRIKVGKEWLVQETGNDALAGFTAPKILWVRENEPDLYARACHILLPKDYVRLQLTGEYGMDVADGAGTILMNLRQRTWSAKLLEALEIPIEWLPPLYEGPQVTGYVTPEAADLTGLKAGTPVVAGGGDQAAQAVGVGVVQEGVVALTLGTSGVVFASTQQPFIDPDGRLHAFCHAVPDRWHLMGVMLSAAGSLRWYRDSFAPGISYDDLLAPCIEVPPGSDGLLFLPYLTGERTPYPDPLARGGFIGITVRHTQPAFTRSVLEGVAFGLRDSFELMKSAGMRSVQQVRVSGGGAKSRLWMQILADVLQSELVTVNTTEGAAYGAALLAGVGAGLWNTVDDACSQVIQLTGRVVPAEAQVEQYQRFYEIYRSLYPALRPAFNQLGSL